MNETGLPTIHVLLCKTYVEGSGSEVVAAATTREDLPNGWDTGITGSFCFYDILVPSCRIQTIKKQGGVFCLSVGGEVGAWLDCTPHSGAFDGQWTWTRAEDLYLRALLILRGELQSASSHQMEDSQ